MANCTFWLIIMGLICGILCEDSKEVKLDVPAFQAKSYGFLTVFQRMKPFVLFTTRLGVQIMNSDNNESCALGRSSIYYPSERQIVELKVNYHDNYIALVDSNRLSCVRNLFNNDWNYGIVKDLKLECQQTTVSNVHLYSISLSRRAIYALQSDGTIIIISIRDPPCEVGLAHSNVSYVGALAFHITGFKFEEDLIFVMANDSKTVHILNTTGFAQYSIVRDGEEIQAIETNQDEQIFLASRPEPGSPVVVLQYHKSLQESPKQIYTADSEQYTIMSMSATNHDLALLLKNAVSGEYRVDIHSLDGNSSDVSYKCPSTSGLLRIHLVDGRDPEILKDICLGTEVCVQNTADCHRGDSFRFEPQQVLRPVAVELEMTWKAIMVAALAVLVAFVMTLYGFLRNTM